MPNPRPLAREKYAAVLDWDGVLGADDAAGLFWRNRGLEELFFNWSHRILQEKAASKGNPANVSPELRPYWPLPHGITLQVVLDQHAQSLRQTGHPLTVQEMEEAGRTLRLTPHARALIAFLKTHPQIGPNRVFINSVTYQPLVEAAAERLGIPRENVFSTPVHRDAIGNVTRTGTLNGGEQKLEPLMKISERTGIPLSRFIGFGDSSGDVPFLPRIAQEGGLAVWFNPAPSIAKRKPGGDERGPQVLVAASNMKHVKNLLRAGLRAGPQEFTRAVREWTRRHAQYVRRAGPPTATRYTRAGKAGKERQQGIEAARSRVRKRAAHQTRKD